MNTIKCMLLACGLILGSACGGTNLNSSVPDLPSPPADTGTTVAVDTNTVPSDTNTSTSDPGSQTVDTGVIQDGLFTFDFPAPQPDLPVICEPGAVQACECSGEVEGLSSCLDDGTGWGDCFCDAPADVIESDISQNQDAGSCIEGETQPCSCEDGSPGTQSCGTNSGGWLPCLCEPTDAGVSVPDTWIQPEVDESGCGNKARLIFLLTQTNMLLTFDPETSEIEEVGLVECPAPEGFSSFSMAIDRTGVAWVLFFNPDGPAGPIFNINPADATCIATGFVPGQEDFEVFGMGFSANEPNGTEETLFVAGGSFQSMELDGDFATLASINPDTLELSTVGLLAHGPKIPELTGTGTADLWGLFAQGDPPLLGRINKESGSVDTTFELPMIDPQYTQAYAFAFWGGDFFIFHRTVTDESSKVIRLDPSTGAILTEDEGTGHVIVGAGVSTCAPTTAP